MIAFLPTLGWQEMFLLVVVGLLLYGRNLPQAGRTMGRFVAQLKRGLQDFKENMDRDEALREVRKSIQDTTREMRDITAVPRAFGNPTNALRELANDAMSSPVAEVTEHAAKDEVADEPAPPSPTTTEGKS